MNRAEVRRFMDYLQNHLKHLPVFSDLSVIEARVGESQRRLSTALKTLAVFVPKVRLLKDACRRLTGEKQLLSQDLQAVEKAKNAVDIVLELKNSQVLELRVEAGKMGSVKEENGMLSRRIMELEKDLKRQEVETKRQNGLFQAAKAKWYIQTYKHKYYMIIYDITSNDALS